MIETIELLHWHFVTSRKRKKFLFRRNIVEQKFYKISYPAQMKCKSSSGAFAITLTLF